MALLLEGSAKLREKRIIAHPACKVHGCKVFSDVSSVFGRTEWTCCKIDRMSNSVIQLVRSIFVGQTRGSYNRDALYSHYRVLT